MKTIIHSSNPTNISKKILSQDFFDFIKNFKNPILNKQKIIEQKSIELCNLQNRLKDMSNFSIINFFKNMISRTSKEDIKNKIKIIEKEIEECKNDLQKLQEREKDIDEKFKERKKDMDKMLLNMKIKPVYYSNINNATKNLFTKNASQEKNNDITNTQEQLIENDSNSIPDNTKEKSMKDTFIEYINSKTDTPSTLQIDVKSNSKTDFQLDNEIFELDSLIDMVINITEIMKNTDDKNKNLESKITELYDKKNESVINSIKRLLSIVNVYKKNLKLDDKNIKKILRLENKLKELDVKSEHNFIILPKDGKYSSIIKLIEIEDLKSSIEQEMEKNNLVEDSSQILKLFESWKKKLKQLKITLSNKTNKTTNDITIEENFDSLKRINIHALVRLIEKNEDQCHEFINPELSKQILEIYYRHKPIIDKMKDLSNFIINHYELKEIENEIIRIINWKNQIQPSFLFMNELPMSEVSFKLQEINNHEIDKSENSLDSTLEEFKEKTNLTTP